MIRVFQRKDSCCTVREPSKRFWYIKAPHAPRDTAASFRAAVDIADELRRTLPQEVTA